MGLEYSQYNNETDMTIKIELNKVCYFPGEFITGTITLFPSLQSLEKIKENPQLTITIFQKQYYHISSNGNKNSVSKSEEDTNLTSTNINFGDIVTPDYSAGYSIPFKLQIPDQAYPTIFIHMGYVKHFFIVELPHMNAKRTKMFVIKNVFPNNIEGNLLKQFVEEKKEYQKSKLFFKKGSCLLTIKMPKNYYFYNEQIPFEINVDCSKLKLLIKSIGIRLRRKRRKNIHKEHSKAQEYYNETINKKLLILEKGKDNYAISDYIDFPTTSKYNSVYPPNVYNSFEEHGLFEVNEPTINYKLYPSSYMGLVSIDYYLDFELNFDTLLTFDEKTTIPLYFSSNYDNNNINQKIQNKGIISPIPVDNSVDTNDCSYSSIQNINTDFTSK